MNKDSTDLVQFNELQTDIKGFVAPALTVRVTDFSSSEHAIEIAKQVKEFSKRVEDTRKMLVEPINKRVKMINDYAKSIVQPLLDAETHLKSQLIAFEVEQEKMRAEERRKAEEELRHAEQELQAKQEEERAALEANRSRENAAAALFGAEDESDNADAEAAALAEKQSQERARLQSEAKAKEFDIQQQGIKNAAKIWKCEIENIDKIPKEFLIITLNEKAILAMARAGVTNIPGVRMWQETTVRIGQNTYIPKKALMG